MNALLHPVGRETPNVYWRRRAIVGGAGLLFLIFLWVLITPSGADPEASGEPAGPVTTAEADADAQAPAPAETTETTSGPALCDSQDIKVTVTTSAESYAAGESPNLRMAIANVSDSPCLRDVGSASNELLITTGDVQVHSSDDCSTTNTPDEVTLQPGQSADLSISWNRQITDAASGCRESGNPAQPGSYQAVGVNGDTESAPVTFLLQ